MTQEMLNLKQETLQQDPHRVHLLERLRDEWEHEIFLIQDLALDIVHALLPGAKLKQGRSSIELEGELRRGLEEQQRWLRDIFDQSVYISLTNQYSEQNFPSPGLAKLVSLRLLEGLLRILSEGTPITHEKLDFLNDVRLALELSGTEIDRLIEQREYQRRREFTAYLLKMLGEDQRYWVARMLWEAIHADHRVDHREYKYLENILQLIEHDPIRFQQLCKEDSKDLQSPEPDFDGALRAEVYRYIVEIVMIDEEYTEDEAAFVKSLGELLGYDARERDDIIQPVASALMIRKLHFQS